MRLLLEHGSIIKESQALHAAATTSAIQVDESAYEPVALRLEVMRILLEGGANVNEMEPDPKGQRNKRPRSLYTGTPLHRAVKDGSIEAVELLLAHGADVAAPSWSGHTALEGAETAGRQDVVKVIHHHISQCQKSV